MCGSQRVGALSVVEAISKRNQTWLKQHPVQRDSAMFNASEVENGPAAREMTHKIGLSEGTHFFCSLLLG